MSRPSQLLEQKKRGGVGEIKPGPYIYMFGYLMSLTYQKFWNLSSGSPRAVMITDFHDTIIVAKQIYNFISFIQFIL